MSETVQILGQCTDSTNYGKQKITPILLSQLISPIDYNFDAAASQTTFNITSGIILGGGTNPSATINSSARVDVFINGRKVRNDSYSVNYSTYVITLTGTLPVESGDWVCVTVYPY